MQLKSMKHEKNEIVEVYYEGLLKLANSLLNKTINSFLIIVFKFGLQPYLHVTTPCMKKETLQQHKETTLVCEEGIFEVEAISNMLAPQNNKIVLAQNPQTIPKKIRMYCTNHNVETCRVKRNEDHVLAIFKVIIQPIIFMVTVNIRS
jgi:hypothetical protein